MFKYLILIIALISTQVFAANSALNFSNLGVGGSSSGGVESTVVGGTTANNDCTGSNCALFNNTSKITSVSRSTTGRFQLTLSSSGCSSAWVCTAAGWDYTNARPTFCGHDGGTGNASTTAFYFACRESGGTYSDGNVKVQCTCKP